MLSSRAHERVEEDGEEFAFADARLQRSLEGSEHLHEDVAVAIEEVDLFGGLHLSGLHRDGRGIDEPEPLSLEREEPGRPQPV